MHIHYATKFEGEGKARRRLQERREVRFTSRFGLYSADEQREVFAHEDAHDVAWMRIPIGKEIKDRDHFAEHRTYPAPKKVVGGKPKEHPKLRAEDYPEVKTKS